MLEQERASGPLAFAGFLDALPQPYQPSAPSYVCHELVPSPQPMEFESYAPPPSYPMQSECYSPYISPFKCPEPGYISPYVSKDSMFLYKCGLPPLESDSESESECYVPSLSVITASNKFPQRPFLICGLRGLLGKIGLHCYNLRQGTNLQFLGVERSKPQGLFCWDIFSVAEDPIRNSTYNLDTGICYHKGEGCMDLIVTHCLVKPEVEGFQHRNERLVADDLFKGHMHNWHPEDALTGPYERIRGRTRQGMVSSLRSTRIVRLGVLSGRN